MIHGWELHVHLVAISWWVSHIDLRVYHKGKKKRRKKIGMWEKNRENQKKITKKTEPWKLKNRLKLWKNRPVRFRFYKSKTEKTKPNRRKPSQTGIYQAKPLWTGFCPKKLNRTEPKPVCLNRFYFFFNFSLVIFFIKTKPNQK